MANVVTREEWTQQRIALLAEEKELTRRKDQLAVRRQEMPWVRVDAPYEFGTEDGAKSLRDLFDGCGQLIVYHFMFGDGWVEGCPSCSFWADNFDGIQTHLANRDTAFLACSSAPLEQLMAYRQRMGWSFPWVSSDGSDFNRDFGVAGSLSYNYRPTDEPIGESPGVSVFAIEDGEVFHTYSAFARGLDVFNGAYQLLDMTPKGRDESDLEWTMAWLRRHDAYND